MFFLMQNIFIVPAMQRGCRAKPVLLGFVCITFHAQEFRLSYVEIRLLGTFAWIWRSRKLNSTGLAGWSVKVSEIFFLRTIQVLNLCDEFS